MVDNQTQKAPEIQVSVDELSNKIKETTDELNQLKNGLNNLSLEQKNDKLSDIENAILECADDLAALEKDGSSAINKKQLDTLKAQINTLTSSKETLKKQIENQTNEALSQLNKSVTQNETTEENQENGDKKGLSGWWSGLNKGQKWGVRIGGTLAGLGILKLGKRIFGGKYDYEKEIPNYSSMTRKQKRIERRNLRKKKRAEKRANKAETRGEFRERPFGRFLKGTGIFLGVGSGIYYLAHGIYTKNWGLNDLFDWKKGKKLKMEEALPVVEGEVNNGKTEETIFRSDFDGIKYDEASGMIKSYNEETKIDVKKRMVEGLNVKFNDLPELIHAANIINCLKHHLGGRAAVEAPFAETNNGGDIQFKFSERGANEVVSASNSSTWTKWLTGLSAVAGIVGGGYVGGIWGAIIGGAGLGAGGLAAGAAIDNDSTLGHACATIASGENFKRFIGHLNAIKDANGKSIWTLREQEEASLSPMKETADKAINRLKNYKVMEGNKDRAIDVKQDPSNPNRYEISSFRQTAHIKIEGGKIDENGKLDTNTITSITIEKYRDGDRWPKSGEGNGLDLHFPNNEEGLIECIRTVDLINEVRRNYPNTGAEDCSIYYRDSSATERMRGWGPKGLNIDTKGAGGKLIRSKEDLQKYYPTLFADLKKTKGKRTDTIKNMIEECKPGDSSDFLCFLNGMVDINGENYFKEKNI